MKAEDTLLPETGIQENLRQLQEAGLFDLAGVYHHVMFFNNQQAQPSFKAGMREVIRYLISEDNGLTIDLHGDKWGKQLKEWGLT